MAVSVGEVFQDEIVLDGTPVSLRHERVSPHDVRLDPDNRRVRYVVESWGVPKDSESLEKRIEEHLRGQDDVRKLTRQVEVNQGLVESIIVKHDGTVVEGNCRTVAYRNLAEKLPEHIRWQEIPVRRLPEEISQRQIDVFLGSLHVAGKNEWSPAERAGYVYHMSEDENYSFDFLADHLRMSKSTLTDLKRSYELFGRYMDRSGGMEKGVMSKWSYFDEFAKKLKKPGKRGRPSSAEQLDMIWWKGPPDLPDKFLGWVSDENKLPQGASVRELAKWVDDSEVLDVFEREGFKAAEAVYRSSHPEEVSAFCKEVRRMILALRDAPRSELSAIRNGDAERIRLIRELQSELQEFLGEVGVEP